VADIRVTENRYASCHPLLSPLDSNPDLSAIQPIATAYKAINMRIIQWLIAEWIIFIDDKYLHLSLTKTDLVGLWCVILRTEQTLRPVSPRTWRCVRCFESTCCLHFQDSRIIFM
jgi:hypothetical protein